MTNHPSYLRVLLTFARNSLVRDMTFRMNFLIDCISSLSWASVNLMYYELIFAFTPAIGAQTGWGRDEYYTFLATTMVVNALVQTFFMPNCEEFSELVRTGGLDFALLKPIDTQFLISCQKIEWSALTNFVFGLGLLIYSVWTITFRAEAPLPIQPIVFVLYPLYVLCGVAILYSLMISLSAASIWMGRNQSLYDFWFYITNFSRYPMEIYSGRWGTPLQWTFTYLIPVLIVVNVPARLIALPLRRESISLAFFAIIATVGSLLASRWLFTMALFRYRSASS